MSVPEPEPGPVTVWQHPLPIRTGWILLAAVLGWIVLKVWSGLFIPWWFNTDEVAFYYEVIRQLRLDLTQTFFDIPGTPFMTLTSLLIMPWWLVERLGGATATVNPSDFAFEHIQGVYTLMRGITLAGYLAAIGLAYSVFRRASGAITGAVAAIVTCTLPIHIHYGHFVRTESLGLVLCLAALLLQLHPRSRRRWQTYLIAGALAGAAMAARFHFAMVGLPVLLAIYYFNDRASLDPDDVHPPHRMLWLAGAALAGIFAAGAIAAALFKLGILRPGLLTHTMLLTTPAGPGQYPEAKQAVAKLWFLLGAGSALVAALQGFAPTRRWLRPFLSPFSLALLIGFSGGFLVAHPTFLWRGEHQLRSIQFYSDWTDPNLAALGPLASWWNVTCYYFTTALPERWLQYLFLAGAGLILWRREPVPLAFLIGAAICFVAHPVTMKLWPHHIIPWLPLLCYVAAYPVGASIEAVTRRLRQPVLVTVILLAVTATLVATVRPRLAKTDEYLQVSRARTVQIAEMSAWLTAHVPTDAFLAVSYFSLNADGFLEWMETSGVPVPQHVKRRRDVHIWWLQRSTLDGHAGYLCVSRADIIFFREDAERKNPNSTYDPFEDRRFKELAAFGGGVYGLKVFQFDLRSPVSLEPRPGVFAFQYLGGEP